MIASRDFSDSDLGGQGGQGANDNINDGLWCQMSNSRSSFSWSTPSGQLIPTQSDDITMFGVYVRVVVSQLGLLHLQTLSLVESGLYTCQITSSIEQTTFLIVWIGENDVYDGTKGKRE